jgi:hypothetical protein
LIRISGGKWILDSRKNEKRGFIDLWKVFKGDE